MQTKAVTAAECRDLTNNTDLGPLPAEFGGCANLKSLYDPLDFLVLSLLVSRAVLMTRGMPGRFLSHTAIGSFPFIRNLTLLVEL